MIKQKKKTDNIYRLLLASIVMLLVGINFFARSMNRPAQLLDGTDTTSVKQPRPTVVSDTLMSKLSFAIDSLCNVSDPDRSLDAFFAELDMLNADKDTVITIVHLGDSHIQAGFLSGRAMRLMHNQFGNAGRGWIAPFKLTKTNEPDDYFISSVVKDWTWGRCTQRDPKCPAGLGGIGIHTISHFVNFDISIAPNNGAGYQFNRIVAYRGEKSMPMLPSGAWKDSVEVGRAEDNLLPGVMTDTFRIAGLIDSLQLQTTRRKPGTDSLLPPENFDNLFYGFNLTNGKPGVLYHSVGVNGAMFVSYTDDHYVSQLALLKPSLLIISLGTNESFGRRFSTAEFSSQIKSLLYLVKKYMPQTAILLTTPPECYNRVWVNKKRTYVRNSNTELAAKAIVNVARQEGIACWDMFEATGGKNSSQKWFNGKYMGRDRVHFNREGYYEQGTLLFKSLMNLKIERENADQ